MSLEIKTSDEISKTKADWYNKKWVSVESLKYYLSKNSRVVKDSAISINDRKAFEIADWFEQDLLKELNKDGF
jgi:hypothetical protein